MFHGLPVPLSLPRAEWTIGAAGRTLPQRERREAGGARRDRTDDLLLAKQALSQLSYGPGPNVRCQSTEALPSTIV